MSRYARVMSFGSAAVLVVLGAICAVVIGGGTGEIFALVLIGILSQLAPGARARVGCSLRCRCSARPTSRS